MSLMGQLPSRFLKHTKHGSGDTGLEEALPVAIPSSDD